MSALDRCETQERESTPSVTRGGVHQRPVAMSSHAVFAPSPGEAGRRWTSEMRMHAARVICCPRVCELFRLSSRLALVRDYITRSTGPEDGLLSAHGPFSAHKEKRSPTAGGRARARTVSASSLHSETDGHESGGKHRHVRSAVRRCMRHPSCLPCTHQQGHFGGLYEKI